MQLISPGETPKREEDVEPEQEESLRANFQSPLRVLALITVVMSCGACRSPQPQLPSQSIHLEPMLIRTGTPVAEPSETIDVGELFQRAYQRFSDRKYEQAIEDYESIIRLFPNSKYMFASLYLSLIHI